MSSDGAPTLMRSSDAPRLFYGNAFCFRALSSLDRDGVDELLAALEREFRGTWTFEIEPINYAGSPVYQDDEVFLRGVQKEDSTATSKQLHMKSAWTQDELDRIERIITRFDFVMHYFTTSKCH